MPMSGLQEVDERDLTALAKSCNRKKTYEDDALESSASHRDSCTTSSPLAQGGGIRLGRPQLVVTPSIVAEGTVAKSSLAGVSSRPRESDEPREVTAYEAYELGAKYDLQAKTVTQAWTLWQKYTKARETGQLSSTEFTLLLRAYLRHRFAKVRDIPRHLFNQEALSEENKMFTFSDFLLWITQHQFSESLLLTDDQLRLRRLAREVGAAVPVVESVKREFDRFDADGTGTIEYSEFGKLVSLCFGLTQQRGTTREVMVLPEKRVKAFWMEIDPARKGAVTLEEFIPWYITHFGNIMPSSLSKGTPLEDFYRSIRPSPWRSGACASAC